MQGEPRGDEGRERGRERGGSGRRGWLCVSRGPPRELCSREPGHWGEVVRACLKQYTQGFSQSSHTQCARSMSLSQSSPATYTARRGKSWCASSHTRTHRDPVRGNNTQTQVHSVKPHVGMFRVRSISVSPHRSGGIHTDE